MISYSQNFEDVILWRALNGIKGGSYIDVGAHHSRKGSVTKTFYDAGWTGINIEPELSMFRLLSKDRPNDITMRCCLGNTPGMTTFFEVEPSGLSTLDSSLAKWYIKSGYLVKETDIEILTLDAIFQLIKGKDVHFLKIDAEGAELDILKSCNFLIHRPWIVVIEAIDPIYRKRIDTKCQEFLASSKYELLYFDGINEFYSASEHLYLKQHFILPPGFLDDIVIDRTCSFNSSLNSDLERYEKESSQLQIKFDRTNSKLDVAEARLNKTYKELEDTKARLNKTYKELEDTKARLNKTYRELEDTKARLNKTLLLKTKKYLEKLLTLMRRIRLLFTDKNIENN